MMNYAEISSSLKKNTGPLYLLYGEEDYFIKTITNTIKSNVLSVEELDFNYSVYDMRETAVETAVEEGETLPFFGNRRVIILKNCYFLTGQREKDKVEHNIKALERYISSPPPETVMVLTVAHPKLDERKKIVKQLKKQALTFASHSIDENMMQEWVREKTGNHSAAFEKNAVERLVQLAGKDMLMLSSELEKILIFAADKSSITVNDINALVARTLEDNVFELVDFVIRKQTSRALRVYYDLLKQNEEPIKLLVLLARQFRIMLHVQELKKRGYSRQKIAGLIKVHPYAVKIAEGQARSFTESRLKSILTELAEGDYEMKTGKVDKTLRLELSIIKISGMEKTA
ncbi:DNA polymerase III subunit delta [Alteribacillus sp. HJP-4]|uniref:DNA polymerase III subunit delta n=1 Tax=Alteribacillus sp. HJP-4 TaxID=2775394 RepID=UPI0035CD01A2